MIRIVRKFAILFAVLTAQLYTAAAYYAWSLPDSYYTADSNTLELDTALHIAAVPAEHTVQAAADTAPASERISLRLFGLIPVKEVEVQQIETPLLVPCGQPFGIKLRMDGALVVGMSDVETAEGSRCPAQERASRPATSSSPSTASPSPPIRSFRRRSPPPRAAPSPLRFPERRTFTPAP